MIDFIKDVIFNWNGSIDWIALAVLLVIVLIILGFLLVGIMLLIDQLGFAMVRAQKEQGTITNKYYSPARNSTGVGVGFTDKGIAPVVTMDSEDEVFMLELELPNKERYRTEVEQACFDHYQVGDVVMVSYKISKWVGSFKITGVEDMNNRKILN